MNNKGLTLFEVIISIAISSIVLLMLTQMLTMNVKISNDIEKNKIMFDQATSIADTLKNEIFELETQKVELIDDGDPNTIIILFTHEYDITINPSDGTLERNYDNPVTATLVYNIEEETITFDGRLLHSSNTKILEGTTFEVIRVDEAYCATNPDTAVCKEGIIKMTLVMTYELSNGNRIDTKEYVTTIIV